MARARQLLLDLGVVRMNRAVLPYMRRKGSGLLLHISSGAGRIGIPGLGFYSASNLPLKPQPKPTTTSWPAASTDRAVGR